MKLLHFCYKQKAIPLSIGLLIGCLLAAPSVLINGRIWAEEGRDFLPYAFANRPWGGLIYAHKQHLDFLPNVAASFAVQGWFKPAYCFVIVAILAYVLLICSAARLLREVNWLVCLQVGLVWGLNPSGWEGLLNSINSWSVLAAAYLLFLAKSPKPYFVFFASLLPAVSFPALLFIPLALLRRYWPQLSGLIVGGLVQTVFYFRNAGSGSEAIYANRYLRLVDFLALPNAFLSRFFLQPLFAAPISLNMPFVVAVFSFITFFLIMQKLCDFIGLDKWFLPQWFSWQAFALLLSLGGVSQILNEPFGHHRYQVVSVLLLPVLLALVVDKCKSSFNFWFWPLFVSVLLFIPAINGLRVVLHAKQLSTPDVACMHRPANGLNQICPRGWFPVQGSGRLPH